MLAILVLREACAGEARSLAISIPSEPVEQALIDVGLRFHLSLGGALEACSGLAPPLDGVFTAAEALARVLDGSGCGFSMPDATTAIVVRLPVSTYPVGAAAVRVEEVVVTATRRAQLALRLPYSLTAIAGTALEASRVRDMNGLAGRVAGLTVTNLGPGRDKVILRGLSDGPYTGLAQSVVGLYLGEIPLTDNQPDPDLRLIDLDRVEVLRGPQGTLYGAGAIGGIVRLMPRRPEMHVLGASVAGTLSFTRHGGLNRDAEAVLNIPLWQDRAALRAVFYRQLDDGYIDNLATGESRSNHSTRTGIRVALRFDASPQWTVQAGGTLQQIDTADTQYLPADAIAFERNKPIAEPHDNDFLEAHLTIEGSGPWGSVLLSGVGLQHDLDTRYDSSPAPASSGLSVFDEADAVEMLAAHAIYASPRGSAVSWLAGLSVVGTRTSRDSSLTSLTPLAGTAYAETRREREVEFAAYGELAYDISESWSLTAGGRLFLYRFDTNSLVTQGPGTRAFDGSGEDVGVSPKLVLSYRPGPETLVYLQASHGYRGGGFNTAGLSGQVFDGNPPREFLADGIWHFEAGAKIDLDDGAAQVRGAAFLAEWHDVQANQYLPSGLPFTANIGDGRIVGIEVEGAWRVLPGLEVGMSALFQDAELSPRPGTFSGQSELDLPGAPAISAATFIDYRRPLGGDFTLHLRADFTYVGKSFITPDEDRLFAMGGYGVADLSAGLEFGGWEALAFVTNATDSRANTFAFGNPFQSGGAFTPLTPRTIGIRLACGF